MLSYRRGSTQHTISVEILSKALRSVNKHIVDYVSYISRGMGVRDISNSESEFQHQLMSLYCCHLIGHIQFPIGLP